MSQVQCIKCGRARNSAYMQEAVFRNFVGDEGIDIWKCASSESCKKERKARRKETEQNDYANGHTYDRT